VIDLLGLDAGPFQGGRDGHAAELGGVEAGQAAADLADRRAGGGQDHGLGHRVGDLRFEFEGRGSLAIRLSCAAAWK
jgi:hypothetical protein